MAIDSYAFRERPAAQAGAPLVFAFHGTGGDENQFFPLVAQIWPRAGVVAPRGDVSEQGALRFFRRKAEGVYDFEDLAVRRRALAAFVDAHKARARPGRTIGLGYSNGANILAAMALEDAELFDEIVLMHPLIPWTPANNPALARLRVLITAGRRDPICPPPLTIALEDHFRRQGAAVTIDWHEGGHEIRPSEQAAVERFAGAGG
ncbi:MAG: alpha/beta hydrolase [Roseiarcus sp.]|jgi:phospholipase/carboxylesterase